MIKLENVTFAYSRTEPALTGVTAVFEENASTALIGANGSGKTTLLLMLTGMYRYRGTIFYRGHDLRSMPSREWKKKIGVMFQNPDHQLFMPTVDEELKLSMVQRYGDWDDRKIVRMLERFGIGHLRHKAPHKLSTGEKKKVALSSVLIHEPEILLFDEPTANLDLKGIRELAEILNSFPMTKIIATHHYEFAEKCCSAGLVLQNGLVAAQKPLPEITGDADLLERCGVI